MLSLDNDALSALVAAVDPGDLLPLALACTVLRDACVVRVSAQLEPGDRVELVGIASEPKLNGRFGRIIEFEADGIHRGRYIVKLKAKPNLVRYLALNPKNLHRVPLSRTHATSSVARVEWAAHVMGGTPTAKWCREAAERGSLAVLEWLRSQDPPCPWDEWTCTRAAGYGHLEILQWLRSQDQPCPWDETTCANAAGGGHLIILQWLRSQDPPCPWDEWTCMWAADPGHLNILQWLRSQDPPCPWDEKTGEEAARSGHLHILQWLQAHDYSLDEMTFCGAASGGHLDILQWLLEEGCPWEEGACLFAIHYLNLTALQWLRNHGCPWDKDECLKLANDHELPSMVAWIQSQPW